MPSRLFPLAAPRLGVGMAAGLCALLSLAAPSFAGSMDEALKDEADKIFTAVKKAKYKNVGVLNFKVQQGSKDATYHAGELNKLMALRVGNMLILGNSLKNPIGIIPNAAEQAAKLDRKATWRTDADRAKLFANEYTRPWKEEGKPDRVKVDAFLTGEVVVSKDFKKSTVTIYLFDKNDTSLRKVTSFDHDTDRGTLTEMDISFKVEKKNLKKNTPKDLDLAAAQSASDINGPDGGGGGTTKPNNNKPPYTTFLDFKVFYNDMLQPIEPSVNPSKWKMPTPGEAGQKVHFIVTNKSDKRIAVVILVNGINTLEDEQGRNIEQYSRWVLEPGKEYGIYGFYPPGGKKCDQFITKKLEEAQQGNDFLSSEVFKIQLEVFADVGSGQDPTPPSVNLRGSANGQTASLDSLKNKLMGMSNVTRANLIGRGSTTGADLQTTEFNGPHAASAIIFYGKDSDQ
jgi:hypothetical protein